MYQQATIIGRVGREPETRHTTKGDSVTSFSVATDRRWKDASGQEMAKTVWFRITCWRKLAEVVSKYVKKGMLVLVVGELEEPKPYQKKDGSYAASLDITASSVKFLSKVSGQDDEDVDFTAVAGSDELVPF